MLYDEHRARGAEDATLGLPRYKWTDPILQREYDKGYDSVFRPFKLGNIREDFYSREQAERQYRRDQIMYKAMRD